MKKKQFLFAIILFATLFTFVSCLFPFDVLPRRTEQKSKYWHYSHGDAAKQLTDTYGGAYIFVREEIFLNEDIRYYIFKSKGGDLPEGSEVHYAYQTWKSVSPDIWTYTNGMALKYSDAETKFYNDLIAGKKSAPASFSNAKIIFDNNERLYRDWDTEDAARWKSPDAEKIGFKPPIYDSYKFNSSIDAFVFISSAEGETNSDEEISKRLKIFLGSLINYKVQLSLQFLILPDSAEIDEVKLSDAYNVEFRKTCKSIYNAESKYYSLYEVEPETLPNEVIEFPEGLID